MTSGYNLRHGSAVAGFDLLLIMGLVLAPMTELRIWKVGPSEMLCALWCARYVRYFLSGGLKKILPAFWVPFILTLVAGTLFCMRFYPAESYGITGLFTWFFMMFLSLGVYSGLSRKSLADMLRILEMVSLITAAWYLFLLVYSRTISPTFLGAKLWYSNARFTGGAANPHQISLLALGMMIVSGYFIARVRISRKRRVTHLACIVFFIYILVLTRSATSWMALVTTAVLGAALVLLRGLRATKANRVAVAAWFTIGALVLTLGGVWLFTWFMDWVASDPNGMGRFELFSFITDPLRKNFLFGLGDGQHSNGGRSEFHNSYLEIIAMTGVIGVIMFVVFSVRLYKSLRHDPYLLLIPCALYMFGMAGFGLRRLPFWALTSFILALADKIPTPKGERVEPLEMYPHLNGGPA